MWSPRGVAARIVSASVARIRSPGGVTKDAGTLGAAMKA
jgi:hypothetical protein